MTPIIVVGVDGSALRAGRRGIRGPRTRRAGAALRIIHVRSAAVLDGELNAMQKKLPPEHSHRGAAAGLGMCPGHPDQHPVGRGTARRAPAEAALDADEIVIGSRGMGGSPG